MELFEQIRREYEFGVGTIAGVSRKLGVHRRLVREALSSAVPGERKPQERKLKKLQAAGDDGRDSGRGPAGAGEAATHGAPHLATAVRRAARLQRE